MLSVLPVIMITYLVNEISYPPPINNVPKTLNFEL